MHTFMVAFECTHKVLYKANIPVPENLNAKFSDAETKLFGGNSPIS